jgi:hypothetical protein
MQIILNLIKILKGKKNCKKMRKKLKITLGVVRLNVGASGVWLPG